MNIGVADVLSPLSLGRFVRRMLGAVGVTEIAFFNALGAFSGYEVVRKR
jgi:hypothetical protein